MQPIHLYPTLDSHTAGATTRIVTAGLPRLSGRTMAEKMLAFETNHDAVRRALILEPRGNANMAGAFLVEPTLEAADLGVLFVHGNGYHSMCGHGAIGVACAAVEMGLVPLTEPQTTVALETPAGLISIQVEVRHGGVFQATLRNVPAFVLALDVPVVRADGVEITVDVAYGGVPVILVDADAAGLSVAPDHTEQGLALGASIRQQVLDNAEWRHPQTARPLVPDHVLFSGAPTVHDAHFKNMVVSSPRQVDRSPCGAGTCARMAQLYQRGRLALREEYVQEGIIGSLFSGRLVAETRQGDVPAVVPEVSARAHIIGINQWIVAPDDTIGAGFLV